jgi:hypothetical protein
MHRWLVVAVALLPAPLAAQTGPGPYARIALLRPRDGHTLEFEAGYIRHLAWHQQARDPWAWYGWGVTVSEKNRWFIYATFGHSATALDSAVAPAEDERDNLLNVAPHVEWMGNAFYEYLPALSRGTGTPEPALRVELTTVDVIPGAAGAFEAALRARQSTLAGETLWYRMVAGGTVPRYVRLRPRPSLAAVLDAGAESALPDAVSHLIARTTVEILTLRPTMSLGLGSPTKP